MKNIVSLILFIPYLLLSQEECAPCDILANPGMEITKIKSDWPTLSSENVIKINSLTSINYRDDDKYWELSERPAWWKNEKSDPWSPTTNWVDNYIEPSQDFSEDYF